MMHFENPGVNLQHSGNSYLFIQLCSSMEKQRSKKRFFAKKTTETAAPADTREKS